MTRVKTLALGLVLLAGIGLNLLAGPSPAQAQSSETIPLIVGTVLDRQNSPVTGASVVLVGPGADEPLAEAETQPDGRFALEAPAPLPGTLQIRIERAHFAPYEQEVSGLDLQGLTAGETLVIPAITLVRQLSPAFWFAAIIFLSMLVLIAAGKLHNTLAALLGTALVFSVSYLGSPINEKLFIFDFDSSLRYVDWNVIFLIMGMMIVIAVVENTGLFQWLAFFAYRTSGGRSWLLLIILMIITGVASAFLDNVTTMLLMTPITVQIALAMGMNPLAFLIPEVMASNVIGISTLIGTPTNILIGSYADISFNGFLTNLTPGVLMAFVGLVIYCLIIYRKV